jgi:hypothetical protein
VTLVVLPPMAAAGGRLAIVPLLEGRMLIQTVLVFAMIALLGLVLRWTFSRDRNAPTWPPEQPPQPGASDDFGLLAEVAALESAEDARRVRGVLAEAGIRATTTVAADGRHRVLVFASDIHRARRVAGGSSPPSPSN